MDIHNSTLNTEFGYEPYIFRIIPSRLQSHLQKYPHSRFVSEEDKQLRRVTIEIPADSFEVKFFEYISPIGFHPLNFFDHRLPINRENFKKQKERVKPIILELAET